MLQPVPSTAFGSMVDENQLTNSQAILWGCLFFTHSYFLFKISHVIKIISFPCSYQAHSNLHEGIKLYEGGYRPNATTLFVNSKSFRNYEQGVRLHLNKNLAFRGLLLADNGIGISSFDNNNPIIFEDTVVIGLTPKAREMMSVSWNPEISGVKFASDPSHTQLSLRNVSFHGFEPHSDGINEYDILALRLWGAFPGMHGAGGTILHGSESWKVLCRSTTIALVPSLIIVTSFFSTDDKRFWNMPSFEGVTMNMNSTVNGFDFERALLADQPGDLIVLM